MANIITEAGAHISRLVERPRGSFVYRQSWNNGLIIMMFIPPIFLFSVYRAVCFGYIEPTSFTAVASIGGGLVALVADIMIIPKTIAEYCFNKEEDEHILKLFANAQQNDSKHKQIENDPWA